MKQYTYLIINILTIFFPVVLSFDKRVAFVKTWKFIWPGMAITGIIFLFWDVLFTIYGVWSFNDQYIIGLRFFGLPLEEILFFLTVPFACIFIYACLHYYVKWQMPPTVAKGISIVLMFVSLILLAVYHNRLYTAVTFALLPVVLLFTFKKQWLSKFYLAYIVSLLPFYIVNGLLTSIPVVLYNNAQNMAIRVTTIPFEDHFYSMALLLMNIAFYEYYKNRKPLAA
ncbi:lycopene cyclase domain-containing protein [Mucilaginibacter sp.]|uniref:lycopene cyclase domain-containing protein n=1 Tax=Mucilaginibacter sp. TaxID=1882438 RepID=UPI000CC8C56E|nr:lycopene cyclase domain-containing protein [Mucilaginibacter sp.]PLW90067.1 MAG: lycopene cyclase domain-containing protein [Mucilaginibacter sp.]HEK19695.1 lycopene cyclase domain-containing protein [Bacteroidota bacterium]